jgi:DNA-binding NtrC family response regulator
MERLAIYHAGREVDVGDLMLPVSAPPALHGQVQMGAPMSVRGFGGGIAEAPASVRGGVDGAVPAGSIALSLPEGGTTFDDLEREILVQVLARAEGNQSKAARSLGLSESTLRSRLKRLGLKG